MKKPWQIQWHIAADGTVIQQRSKGDQPHQQLYGRYTTNRRLELSDLYAVDERLRRDNVLFHWLTTVLLYAGYLAIAAFVVGIALGYWPGAPPGLSFTLWVVSVPVLIVAGLSTGFIPGLMVRRGTRIYLDAGFESSNPITLGAHEARAMIEAPGAVSGVRSAPNVPDGSAVHGDGDQVIDAAALLRAYDDQLRTDAEVTSALAVSRHGPLVLATYGGGRGFVTYRSLPADADGVRRLVTVAAEHFAGDPAISEVEWKSRGHDRAPGLHEALVEHGFVPGEPEAIMIGEAAGLVVDVSLPDGVTLRRVTSDADVRAMSAMQSHVFGNDASDRIADELIQRLERSDGLELWVAEARGLVVSAGRLDPVAGTEFAGIWGGATLPEWRGRGIYRALTSVRARSALARGKQFIHSDSTEFSRPILERSGLIAVSTTTPYLWRP